MSSAISPDWLFPFCPTPPDRSIDWDKIEKSFTWIQEMDGVRQEPEYHAEGDVLIHTRMVAEAMTGLKAWQQLSPTERSQLFAATLLHDVAKPACTKIEANGRITSKNHARQGEKMARRILWQGEHLAPPVPLQARETIAKLVRFHGLPLWFLEKSDPQRAIIAASQSVRLDQVALLAEADVRGRICADQQALLDRIELFREFCQEQSCYTHPRAFADDYSRFVYFHSEQGYPEYAAYDTTEFEVTLMAGLPGVGKDTWIQQNIIDRPVITLDAIRKELRIAPEDNQGQVIQEAKERARELMRKKQSFVWNATNITRMMRSQLIDFFTAYGARVRIVYLEAPLETLLKRNRERDASVPEHVIYKLMGKLEVPDLTEAHHVELLEV